MQKNVIAFTRRSATVGACVAGVFALNSATAHARPEPRTSALDRQLSAGLDRVREGIRVPAAMATVMVDGRVVWEGASGRATTPQSLVTLGSTVKLLVATMILEQVQAGRLVLDDPVTRWYPDLRGGQGVTVRMLLDHTSGLAEYDNSKVIDRALENPRHHWTRDEVLDALGPRQFAPGSRFSYTNTNYIVLGGILEKVTGRTTQQSFMRGIARPLGISAANATFDRTPSLLPRFVHSPSWVRGYGPPNDAWGPVWTDGGLATTATVLARVGDGILGGHLLRRSTLCTMTTLGKGGYGLGVYSQRFDGHRWLGHQGDYAGWSSEVWRDDARRVTITITTNRDEPADTSTWLWRAVVRAYDRQAVARG